MMEVSRPVLERPIALVLTKGDLLDEDEVDADLLADRQFGMTRPGT